MPTPLKLFGASNDGQTRFIRLVRDETKTPTALETAVTNFSPTDAKKNWPKVDLIAAIHVADKSYYSKLNILFETYDSVLFELVAPQGTRIPKGTVRIGTNPVSMLQHGMTKVLELEHQLSGIDYTKQNMIHADMSPSQLSKSMAQRKESFMGIALRMMGFAMTQQHNNSSKNVNLLMAFFDPDQAIALKRTLAQQFESLETSMQVFDGPNGSTLITERNKVALDRLSEEISKGKHRIAIFYGGGHMTDMARRLNKNFNMVQTGQTWLKAWDLSGKD